jgi:hypothetical protein
MRILGVNRNILVVPCCENRFLRVPEAIRRCEFPTDTLVGQEAKVDVTPGSSPWSMP